MGSLDRVQLRQGLSAGAVCTVQEVARRLGLEAAPGHDCAGPRALWQVLARVLEQGARDVSGLRRGFAENHRYAQLGWLGQQQEQIEDRLLAPRQGQKPEWFL